VNNYPIWPTFLPPLRSNFSPPLTDDLVIALQMFLYIPVPDRMAITRPGSPRDAFAYVEDRARSVSMSVYIMLAGELFEAGVSAECRGNSFRCPPQGFLCAKKT
jgi:hypothetical protein